MRLSHDDEAFLVGVCKYNERFNAVVIGAATERLYHSFWTSKEIADADRVKADWRVPAQFIPFYGDWHDLFCLDIAAGAVVCLNDARHIRHRWNSTAQFVSSLTQMDESTTDEDLGIADEWIDPSLGA